MSKSTQRLGIKVGRLPDKMKKELRNVLASALVLGEGIAKQNAPFRTGNLSQGYTINDDKVDKLEGELVNDVFYAPFVELGTSKMDAQPHFFPAVEEALDFMFDQASQVLGRELRKL